MHPIVSALSCGWIFVFIIMIIQSLADTWLQAPAALFDLVDMSLSQGIFGAEVFITDKTCTKELSSFLNIATFGAMNPS